MSRCARSWLSSSFYVLPTVLDPSGPILRADVLNGKQLRRFENVISKWCGWFQGHVAEFWVIPEPEEESKQQTPWVFLDPVRGSWVYLVLSPEVSVPT